MGELQSIAIMNQCAVFSRDREAVNKNQALPSPADGECKDPKSLVWSVVPCKAEGSLPDVVYFILK